jgi:ankyrin repeat protein
MLLHHGAVVDVPRSDGRTAYALAVRSGNSAVAEFLESAGADTGLLMPEDRLAGALANGDADGTRALVRRDPEVLASIVADDDGAFLRAVEDGREESVRLMLDLGWSIADEGPDGGTPLHWASWHGRPGMVTLLLDRGAAVNVRDVEFGSSPIAWAAHGSVNSRPGNDDDYLAVVELLLDAGSLRELSYNKWNEPPESLGSAAVTALLRRRGFA